MDISSSGNYNLLCISGEPTTEQLISRWEEIIRENGKHNGDKSFETYFQLIRSYALIIAEYVVVQTSLMLMLTMPIDFELVTDMRKRGYKMDVNSNDSYHKSIQAALSKVKNCITRAIMKRKEIDSKFKDAPKQGQTSSFSRVIASINAGMGWQAINDSTSLVMYNEYRSILKEKALAMREQARTKKR